MKISIITVNLNNSLGLEKTLNSISLQTYNSFELIVVDGDSIDDSVSVIRNNSSLISKFLVEKDKGVYDAMNKGIELAKGDYLFFLNSGDTFYNSTVLENFIKLKPKEDLIYGNVLINYKSGVKKIKKMPSKLNVGEILITTITHQAIFHKRELFLTKKYDLKYKIIADWVFYVNAILFSNSSYRHVDLLISNFESGGLSSNSKLIKEEKNEYFNSIFSKHSRALFNEYINLYNLLNNNIILKNGMRFVNAIKKLKKNVK
ncbi:glycosyltransferase family 2 protein [uncultured Polaribacter sp.]|uniref:glycosyltransferase family 2 protein n=1 Tax=uncultured Polaribacter sp. TaxID=174711 RepID=UPI00260240BD|nr:glycosyltransferase family 2 protein [uncultured Polaribacter sp.]